MLVLATMLDVVYTLIGLLFAAGAGAMMLMFAFIQVTARVAIWLDVMAAFKERSALQAEVQRLKAALNLAFDNQDAPDPDAPLVTAVKVGEPGGD